MSLIDHAIKANEQFAKRYDPKLGGRPEPKIAVVTCMDPRLSDLEGILGLEDCRYRRHSHGRTGCDRRRPGRACGFHAGFGKQGNHAPQSHRLRVHNLHRQAA